jgi:hypothetical protein
MGGAKGQSDVSYTYAVSMAVALSSRGAKAIKRIWADGKLLRGEAGDFKVGTEFRFYSGDEDQVIDPLIGSLEGIANTPAYRGLALAVFENLELAEYGNRIPFLTFEIVADDEPPTVGAVVEDAATGSIHCNMDKPLIGFAAYGRSIGNAIEPLIDGFDIKLFDDGEVLRPPSDALPIAIDESALGNSADEKPEPRYQREQLAARSVPVTLRLTYYDPARDYQTGEVRATAGESNGGEVQVDLAAVLQASDAKSLAQQMLSRQWTGRDKLTLRLPPKLVGLEPGSRLIVPFSPSRWSVEKVTIEGFVVIAELRPSNEDTIGLLADSGRIVPNSDVEAGPVMMALLDIPNAGRDGDRADYSHRGWVSHTRLEAPTGRNYIW